MRIVVTNAVLTNSGDAAIFQGIEESLKSDENIGRVQITVFDNNARVSRPIYPDWDIMQQPSMSPASSSRIKRLIVRSMREAMCKVIIAAPWVMKILNPAINGNVLGEFGRALKTMASADLVISSGGTYLVDHYDFRPRITELELASRLGKPVVLWTQSMGPFQTPRARRAISRLENRVAACYFRDQRSLLAWQSILPNPPIFKVVPDVALSLEKKTTHGSRTVSEVVSPKRRVAISVREWHLPVAGAEFSFDGYTQALRETVVELDKQGYECVAISTCQGTPGYAVDDAKTALRMFENLPITVDEKHHSPNELLSMLDEFDLIISTRMHLAILGIVAKKPVIAIAYETKTNELFAGIGLGQNVISIEDVDSNWILGRIDSWSQNPSIMSLAEGTIESLQADARIPAHDIGKTICPNLLNNAAT